MACWEWLDGRWDGILGEESRHGTSPAEDLKWACWLWWRGQGTKALGPGLRSKTGSLTAGLYSQKNLDQWFSGMRISRLVKKEAFLFFFFSFFYEGGVRLDIGRQLPSIVNIVL